MTIVKNPSPPAEPAAADTSPPGAGARLAQSLKFMSGAFFWVEVFFVIYLARPEDWIPGLHVIPLAKIAGIFAILAFVLSFGRAKMGLPREVYYLAVLTAYMGLASILSPVWRGGAVQVTEGFAKVVVIIAVMSVCVLSLQRLRRLIYLQAASAAVIAVISIIRGHELGGRLEGALGGIYSNPNDLALAMALTFPFAFTFMMRARNPVRRTAWVVLMLVMAYCVLMTGSRGGFIALFIAAAGCVWVFGVRQRRVLLVFFAFVAIVVMLPIGGKLVLQRLQGTFNPNENIAEAYGSAQARVALLKVSLRVSLDHPLFGIGPGNFPIVSGWHETHDLYTEWAAEAGIPALIIFLVVFYRAFRNTWAVRQSSADRSEFAMFATAVRTDLVVLLICSFFYPVAYHFFVYFLFAYATALYWIKASGGDATEESWETRHHPGALRVGKSLFGSKPNTVWTARS